MKIIYNITKILFIASIMASTVFVSCDDDDKDTQPHDTEQSDDTEQPDDPTVMKANDDYFEYSYDEWIAFTERIKGQTYYANYNINDLLDNDNLLEGSDKIKFEVLTQPVFGKVDMLGKGYVNYKPDATFNGQDSFEYQICKNDECSQAKVSIKVNNYKNPIVEEPISYYNDLLKLSVDEWYKTTKGEKLSINPKALAVYKKKFKWTKLSKLQIIGEPSYGAIKLVYDPSLWETPYYISYEPNDEFNGEDLFEYEMCTDSKCYTGTVTISVADFDKNAIYLMPDTYRYDYYGFRADHTYIAASGKVMATLFYEFSEYLTEYELRGLSYNDIEIEVKKPANGRATLYEEGAIGFQGEFSYEDARKNGYEVLIEYTLKYKEQVHHSSINIIVDKAPW
ncbi:Ig-like domain-containing protein [Fulvivirga sediminis]|uniref:Uncharacterized protein n=1 Tax=Fulvivirga sediminis TaxID=2803949 RepID=A0A937FDK3_9BACT|nr:Ig-like domain-containing protein [Fulvivirga sediminis]MBL3658950.1 hypothetical protein [Fulvivirga sediminis]